MTSSWVKKNLDSIKNLYLTATQIKLMSESIKCRWTLRGAKTHVRSRASVGEKRIYFYFEDMWRVFLRTTGMTFDCLPYECWIGSIESYEKFFLFDLLFSAFSRQENKIYWGKRFSSRIFTFIEFLSLDFPLELSFLHLALTLHFSSLAVEKRILRYKFFSISN